MAGDAERLFGLPWEELQGRAWAARRQHHADTLRFAVPGNKRYDTEDYHNTPHRFANVSVTGRQCRLMCEHCRGELLDGMMPATTPDELLALGRRLIERGCEGLLVSGGADADGQVPLQPFLPALARLKEWGLAVIVHTGVVERETARGLRDAAVDQVLFDVVGDAETIRQVLHLDLTPEDYGRMLALLREFDLPIAPHVVIGLHFGQLRGELRALEMVRQAEPAVVVLVVLRPLPHTPMAGLAGVDAEAVGRLAAVARLLAPSTPLTLGCARPAGLDKVEMERRAVLAGVNSVAYPDPATVRLAGELGLTVAFLERCCTLTVGARGGAA